MKRTRIPYSEWFDEYKPLLDKNGIIVDCDPRLYKTGTISEEEFNKALSENRVWSQLDPPDLWDEENDCPRLTPLEEDVYALSGLHIVDVTQLIITEKPFPADCEVEVMWDD